MREIDDPAFIAEVTKGIALQDLEQRLRPNSGLMFSSMAGFLGSDEQLLKVVHSDWETVNRYGTTHSEIAEALRKLLRKEQLPASGFAFRTQKDFLGFGIEILGQQDCPWSCKARGNTQGVLTTMAALEERLPEIKGVFLRGMFRERSADAASTYAIVTGLLPHLVEAHYFFEGRQSPYRADPALLIPAIGLAKK